MRGWGENFVDISLEFFYFLARNLTKYSFPIGQSKANGVPIALHREEILQPTSGVLGRVCVIENSWSQELKGLNLLEQYATRLSGDKRWNGSYRQVWRESYAVEVSKASPNIVNLYRKNVRNETTIYGNGDKKFRKGGNLYSFFH